MLSIVATTAASAVPTTPHQLSLCRNIHVERGWCSFLYRTIGAGPASDAHVTYLSETSRIIELSNTHLANIGVELLKPPVGFTDSAPVGAKVQILPPAPAALFMSLTGFLCVSLVKDRKVWLTALAGLLWAGQAGLHAIPQFAANMNSKKHIQRKSSDNTACLYRVQDCCRMRSDIEGTQYIGLLHRLAAIPASMVLLPLPASLSSLQEPRCYLIASHKSVVSVRTRSNSGAPQFALTHFLSLLNSAVICPAPRAQQYAHFSPASTFAQLARGPPNPGPIIVTSFLRRAVARGPFIKRLM